MIRVVLLIRRSADYLFDDKLSMPSCNADKAFWAKYRRTILSTIDWWNNSFNIPYMEFRKQFRRISAQLIIDSQFDMVINHLDWHILRDLEGLRDTWIVPQDEDDWPSLQAPATLRRVNPRRYDGVLWDTNRICECNSSFILCDREYYRNNVLLSNAYAVRVGGSETHITLHGQAQKFLERSTIRYIQHPLSVKVDGPASLSLLRLVKSEGQLQDLVGQFKVNRLDVPMVYKEAYERYLELVLAL